MRIKGHIIICQKLVLLTGIILVLSFQSWSQGLVDPIRESKDTLMLKSISEPEKGLLLPGLANLNLLNTLVESGLNIPDFKTLLNSRWIYNQSLSPALATFHPAMMVNGPLGFTSPFYYSGVIFNQAAYKISDKLVIGGAGFGGRSIFSAPLPGNLTNSFDTRGASMFFQYKVSPKFKIETRVSVTKGPGF